MSNLLKYCFLVLSFALICCQKGSDTIVTSLPEKNLVNVSYGTDAAQKMDVYLPARRTDSSTKVLILIHGGGWNIGDKSDFLSYVDTLKRRLPDYAIFNINYRLATGATNFFPTQENDIKAAVEYIFSKTNEYNISQKFVMVGASAGAHLSLLQAYKNTMPVKIKAVVDFFGPTDLIDMYNNPASSLAPPAALAMIIGATPTTNSTLYQQSSPINFVSAQGPPTIILQGGADVLVSPSQSLTLKNKLQIFGVVNQYVFYPSENHGWIGANLVDSFDKITAFLTANVN
jgi:acetyl esterase/lipase